MKQANTPKRRKKEKINLKPWLIIGAILLLLLAVTAIVYFVTDDGSVKTPDALEFTYSNGTYHDEENDITYVAAPFYYQSKLMTSADYPYGKTENVTLYRVGYRDEEELVHLVSGDLWLSTSMDIGAVVYYNPDKVDLPDPAEFGGDEIYLCEPDGETIFSTTKLEGATASKLLNDFFAQEDSMYDELQASCERVANLKVSSSQYKWLYLNLWLYTDADGNFYLSEDVTRKFHPTDGAIFEPFLKDAEETEAS